MSEVNNSSIADTMPSMVKLPDEMLGDMVPKQTPLSIGNMKPEQIQAIQQLAERVSNQLKTRASAHVAAPEIEPTKTILTPENATVPIPDAPSIDNIVSTTSSYFTLFGLQLSKTTLYIFIVFILVVIGYLIYSYWFGSSDKKKKRRQKDASYKEQEGKENEKCDKDDSGDC